MDLFDNEKKEQPFDGGEFAREFARLASELDLSSKNPTKNQPLERLFHRYTGWPVNVKGANKENLITNRFGETKNKSGGTARYLVLLTPADISRAARGVARREMAEGNWDVVVLGIRDRVPPVLTHVFHGENVTLPEAFLTAFPTIENIAIGAGTPAAGSTPSPIVLQAIHANYSIAECAADTGLPETRLRQWLGILQRKKQMVFQGPPGSGKTYVAKRLARLLVGGSTGRTDMVQFHPSMTYEDFVQGLRPSIADGQIQYSLEPGRFMQLCEDAQEQPQAPHVLIIDEINRGNLSRIFGELLYLLEYRGESIMLAQGEVPFCVPQNLYLIATMNTADRSIALVDHALRRRFSFVFLGPDYDHLSNWLRANALEDGGQLVDVLRAVNQRIGDRHYHLGTSYFLSAGPALATHLPEIWQGEIEPHLDEYFFDQPEVAAEFSWTKLSTTALSWWGAGPGGPATAGADPADDASA